jgi:plasmid maintenance system antidote protein VapI
MSKDLMMSHPGTILKREFLEPLGLSAYRICKVTGIDKMTLIPICDSNVPLSLKSLRLRLSDP